MKRKITGTLLALLISGSSIVASASTVMGISSEYLPEIEEAVENEDPEDGGSETESIQQEQFLIQKKHWHRVIPKQRFRKINSLEIFLKMIRKQQKFFQKKSSSPVRKRILRSFRRKMQIF